jgi:hypothetical protein
VCSQSSSAGLDLLGHRNDRTTRTRGQKRETRHVENNNDDSKLMGRRRSLQMLGFGLTAAGGLLALAGCKGSEGSGEGNASGSSSAAATDCNATIDEAAKNMRKAVQYNDVATDPNKHCSVCVQYQENKYAGCGAGCKLFAGPVKPNGGCLSFAPKAGGAPSAAPSASASG